MKQFKSQSGRSMVEMLGVLAIVGVLSIGGIAGYSYGMDKYRANETTNQIMLRAIDLMTQASQGHAELSLAEWSKEASQYDFGEPSYTNDGLIVFDVGSNNPMPKSVCEMVFDNMSGTAVQIDINKIPTESNDACVEENEMTFYFEGGISVTCDPACPEGQYCDNGICFKGGVPEVSKVLRECSYFGEDCGQPCYSCDYDDSGSSRICRPMLSGACTIDGKDGVCRYGECYPKGDGCTTNEDCTEPGTYCASTNSSCTERFESGQTGVCAKLDFIKKEFGGQTYYISNTMMNWWDAEYACDAIGSNIDMVGVTDLVTESDGSKWTGDTGIHTPTDLLEKLATFTGDFFWTKDLSDDSCGAFSVDTDGYIFDSYHNRGTTLYDSDNLVVCR